MAAGIRKTLEQFIVDAQSVHGLKYNYEQTVYLNVKTKVCITCTEHGDWFQLPSNHLSGAGCPKCNDVRKSEQFTLTQNEWIKKAKEVHFDLFDYSLVEYKNSRSFVKIICKKHGMWEQYANSHLQGNGCQKCKYEILPQNQVLTTEEWVKRADQIHFNKYDYSKVKYTGWENKVIIICSKHGEFEQMAGSHLQNVGCPKCRESHGEKYIREWLLSNNIDFLSELRFDNCRDKNPLPFDFYLLKQNLLIEYDGEQHYIPHSFSSDRSEVVKQKNLDDLKYKDQIKNQYCLDNNIELVRIPYWDFDNIEKILEKEIKLI